VVSAYFKKETQNHFHIPERIATVHRKLKKRGWSERSPEWNTEDKKEDQIHVKCPWRWSGSREEAHQRTGHHSAVNDRITK
jgi:hypothetical protein